MFVSLMNHGTLTMREIKQSPHLTLLCDVQLEETVSVYDGTMSEGTLSDVLMIHVGDFVEYCDGVAQVSCSVCSI